MPTRLSIDLESIVNDFEQSWRQGNPPPLERFLPSAQPAGSPSRVLLLRELIKIDLEFRWRHPAKAACHRLEDYLLQFPELGQAPLDLIAEEYRVRHRWADRPSHQSYLERFPEHAAYLPASLERIDAELALEFSKSAATAICEQDTVPPRASVMDMQAAPHRQDAPVPELPRIPGYELLGVLGRGGMGVVYKAKHLALKRLVALKMIVAGSHAGPDQLARFQAEAEAVAKLKHPNIVQIYDVGNHEGLPYFALEYVEAGSLDKKLAGTPQDPRAAAGLVLTLAQAMHAAHQAGIIHRDLKPANVLLSPLPTGGEGPGVRGLGTPKITDFGLAKQLDAAEGQTRSGAIMGTPSYMAPEQANGQSKEIGPVADVYALGAILYEMLTGRPPFKAATALDTIMQVIAEEPVPPRRLQPKVPRDLETICLKCLQKDPRKRYVTAEDLGLDLRRFLNHEPILARPVGAVERLSRWARRQPIIASLSAAILALIVISFALVTWQWRESLDRGEKLSMALDKEKTALDKEKQARTELQQTAYFDKITAANAEFYADNVREAAALLDDCLPALRGWEWHYLNRLCRGAHQVCGKPGDAKYSVAFHPRDMVIASRGKYEVCLFDARTGELLQRWPSDQEDGHKLRWEMKGKWLAVAHFKEIRLHEPETGVLQRQFMGHTGNVQMIASSPKGKLLASGADNGQVIIWNGDEGKVIHTLQAHATDMAGLAFHPDGDLLASAGRDNTIKLWNVSKGEAMRTLSSPVTALAWSPCGQWIVSASRSHDIRIGDAGTIKVWEAQTGIEMREVSLVKGYINDLAFRLDGKQLAAACASGLRRWTWPELRELPPIRSLGLQVSYSADGCLLATQDGSGLVKIWDSERGQEPVDARSPRRTSIFAMAAHPKKPLVACGDGRGGVEVIDVTTRKLVQEWQREPKGAVFAVTWNPEGTMVAAGRQDNSVLLCRIGTADCQVLEGHRHRVYGVAFSPDGKQLVSASVDKTIRVWDVATGKEVHQIAGSHGTLHALAVDPQDRFLAAADGNGLIRLWHLASRQPYAELQAHPAVSFPCLAFRPDGAELAAGGPSGATVIHLWNVATRSENAQCRGHKDKITSVAWSPDGKRLVSSSDDSTIRLWEPKSGRLLLTLRGHKGSVTAAAFSADGQLLISTGWDGAVRVWHGTPVEATGNMRN